MADKCTCGKTVEIADQYTDHGAVVALCRLCGGNVDFSPGSQSATTIYEWGNLQQVLNVQRSLAMRDLSSDIVAGMSRNLGVSW